MNTHDTASKPRGRGRPPGSSWLNKEDMATLPRVADIVVVEGIAPTTAMHRLGHHTGDASLRRLQRKWGKQGERLLAEAQERKAQAEARKTAAVDLSRHPLDWTRDLAHIRDAIEGPLERAMRKAALEQLPFERAMRDAKAAGLLGSFHFSPAVADAVKQMRGLTFDPRLAEQIEKWTKAPEWAKAVAEPQWMRSVEDLSKKLGFK